jgi:NADH:ubiquinone oxidoreductase subunit 4 (subunit M)
MEYVFHPLILVTFFPLLGVLVILFLNPEANKSTIRWTALITGLITYMSKVAFTFVESGANWFRA